METKARHRIFDVKSNALPSRLNCHNKASLSLKHYYNTSSIQDRVGSKVQSLSSQLSLNHLLWS